MGLRDLAGPLAVAAFAWAIWCILFGPVVAMCMLAGCAIIGGPLARWVGGRLFGAGG